jgi:hypothetical protein
MSGVSATAERTPAADFGVMFRMDSSVILPDFQGHPTESVLRAAVSFLQIKKNSYGAKLGGKEGMGPHPCFLEAKNCKCSCLLVSY